MKSPKFLVSVAVGAIAFGAFAVDSYITTAESSSDDLTSWKLYVGKNNTFDPCAETNNILFGFNNAVYKLSKDMVVNSICQGVANLTFDFTAGNHTLKVCNAVDWGKLGKEKNQGASTYTYPYCTHPSLTLKGGTWDFSGKSTHLSNLGVSGTDKDYAYTFTASDKCVMTNVGSSILLRRINHSSVKYLGGTKYYGTSMTFLGVSGAYNNIEVGGGSAVNLSGDFNTVNETQYSGTGNRYSLIDIYGKDADNNPSRFKANSFYLGRGCAHFTDCNVRDGAAMELANGLFIGYGYLADKTYPRWGGTNCTFRVTDAKLTAPVCYIGATNNCLVVSNSTVVGGYAALVLSATDGGIAGCHNRAEFHNTKMQFKLGETDAFGGRSAHHNEIVVSGGSVWTNLTSTYLMYGSNHVFRLTGKGTEMICGQADYSTEADRVTTFAPGDSNNDTTLYNKAQSRNNVVEVSDGAKLLTNRFFLHGYDNHLVISNGTVYTGSCENKGTSGYTLWLGRGKSNGCKLIMRGTTPALRSTFDGEKCDTNYMLQSGSAWRFEVPAEGYAEGHIPITGRGIYRATANSNQFEIECSAWAANAQATGKKMVLARFRTKDGTKDALNASTLNLPANVRCYVETNSLGGYDLVLYRKGNAGMIIVVR